MRICKADPQSTPAFQPGLGKGKVNPMFPRLLTLAVLTLPVIAQPGAPPPPAPNVPELEDEINWLGREAAEMAGRQSLEQISAAIAELAAASAQTEYDPWFLAQAAPVRVPPAPPAVTYTPAPVAVPRPPRPATTGFDKIDTRASEDALYRRGSYYIDRREWEKAVQAYDAVVAKQGSKIDAAQYWKAYALGKWGRNDQALEALKEFESKYAKSRWLNDAKALEIEVRQSLGKPVSPEEESNEDLKLMAIHALGQSDPQRALPLLEKIIFGSGSPKLKERALFVLAQSDQPRSREILLRVAKGQANPDLQIYAIQFLGMRKGAAADLVSLYNVAADREMKMRIIQILGAGREIKPLVDIARAEKDPALKRSAVQILAATNSKEATDLLIEILEK